MTIHSNIKKLISDKYICPICLVPLLVRRYSGNLSAKHFNCPARFRVMSTSHDGELYLIGFDITIDLQSYWVTMDFIKNNTIIRQPFGNIIFQLDAIPSFEWNLEFLIQKVRLLLTLS